MAHRALATFSVVCLGVDDGDRQEGPKASEQFQMCLWHILCKHVFFKKDAVSQSTNFSLCMAHRALATFSVVCLGVDDGTVCNLPMNKTS